MNEIDSKTYRPQSRLGKNRTPLRWSSVLLAFILAIVVGCDKSPKNNSSRSEAPITVRVAYPPMVATLPFIIAQDSGLFSTNEVEIKETLFTSSNDMLNSLVAGPESSVFR